ncbi:BTAD domain-containing putative transcriptional regulator [Amycolatopsis alba]|nr:BTAD domain-containing putative transcriptional regulator [Amycolatopsis alba]
MTLGKALLAYRARTGITQDELARRAGISVRTLRDIEHEVSVRPHSRSVRKLVQATGLSAVEIDSGVALRIDVLGPMIVHDGPRRIDVGAPMLRRLLGLLALRANEPVSRSEIVDFLWGEGIPATYRNLLHTYASRIRRLLRTNGDEPQPLERGGTGYRLTLTAGQTDVLEFLLRVADAAALHEAGRLKASEGEYEKALSLWRGPALADLGPEIQQHPAVVALTQRRMIATLAHADLAFAHGRHHSALPGLRDVAETEPLHEGINARIILALTATGQRQAAVRLFHELSVKLRESFGVDPGTELRAAYLHCLEPVRATPPRTGNLRAPEQLPPDSTTFMGRASQLAELDAFLSASDHTRRAARVVVITGSAGVGKTALAIHWAHRVSGRFPDGQLYYNLHGFSDSVTRTAGDALTAFLTGLGVTSTAVPLDLEARAALLRSLLADREVLLVLDNVTGPEHVLPVLPANSRSMVAVTSRNDLSALGLHADARSIELDVLGRREAVTLLARLLNRSPDTPALSALSDLCARLPLALRIVAANLAGRAHDSLDDYVTALRAGNRLAGLAVGPGGGAAVQTAFELSYATLGPESACLFRLLGLVPSADVSIAALAALAGDTVADTVKLADRLVGAHLVQRRTSDRYQVHDLLRLYAAQLCAEVDSEDDRALAWRRLSEYYLRTAAVLTDQAYPGMLRLCSLPETEGPGGEAHVVPSDWLAAERGSLAATVLHAAEHGPRELSWQITDVLRGYLWRNYDVATWRSMAEAALTAAQREGNKSAEAAMHYSLGAAHRSSGQHPLAAKRHLRRAERMFQDLGMPEGQAAALDCLGTVLHHTGSAQRALAVLERSIELCRKAGFTIGLAKALCTLGFVAADLGLAELARERLLEALALSEELADKHLEALALHNLSQALQHTSRYEEAMDGFHRALTIRTEIGDTEGIAATLGAIGHLSNSTGKKSTAHRYWRESLAVFDRLGHPAAESIRPLLGKRGFASLPPEPRPATISAQP